MRELALAILLGLAASSHAQEPPPPPDRFMLFFDWGMSDIRTDDAAVLDQAAAAYHQRHGARLQLSGFTDRSGSAAYNVRAARKRAEGVRAELIKRRVPAGAMTIASHGEERSLVPTEDGVREVQNRRVEISLAGGSDIAAPRGAPLHDAHGAVVGTVEMVEDMGRLTLRLSVGGLPAGIHGVHLHEAGLCEGPAFKSAAAHWNPAHRQHGHDNPQGAHLGDLTNIEISGNGEVATVLLVESAAHAGGAHPLADADGTSLVIHAAPDDYKTDPSGNSGERIACAVLAAPALT